MSKLYHNPTPSDATAPLLAPRIRPARPQRRAPAVGVITGRQLRAIRSYHRMSQTDLARVLSVTRQAVSAWELGRSAIPYDVYPALLMLDAPKDRLGNGTITPGLAIVDLRTYEVLRLF